MKPCQNKYIDQNSPTLYPRKYQWKLTYWLEEDVQTQRRKEYREHVAIAVLLSSSRL